MNDYRAFVSIRFTYDVLDAPSEEGARSLVLESLPKVVLDMMDDEGFVLWDVVVTTHDPRTGFPNPIDTNEWRD